MPPGELIRQLWESVREQKFRAVLTILGIVIGISSVVLLSSIGEGTRRGIAAQFTQFGTTLISIVPGKTETFGSPGALLGTTRPLKLEDIEALRRVPGVKTASGHTDGTAEVEWGRRSRRVFVFGTMHEGQQVFKWGAERGTFIPPGDPRQMPRVCVLGPVVAEELFGGRNPLGETVRVGGARFRVIGIMEPKGTLLGFNLDDAVYIPVCHAMTLFNQFEIHEINVEAANYREIDRIADRLREVMRRRHGGEEDFTIITQAAMLEVIDNVMGIITKGVIGIATIAIFVGAMGILTITWVSVHERRAEIGLCKAVGAGRGQILALFLGEATLLSTLGGIAGIMLGVAGGRLLEAVVPGLRVELPPATIPICVGVSVVVGAMAGMLPALRASRLDPVEALREE